MTKRNIIKHFTIRSDFVNISIGGEFVEVLTTCNEVAVRTEQTSHQGKTVNARRVGGKLIFMADWEPVFVRAARRKKMPRNISFFHTQDQIRAEIKDITRRLGWLFLKPGDILNACEKCQGLREGEKIVKICQIRVVSVRREPLEAITPHDVRREGFPKMVPVEFVEFFCKAMGCFMQTIATRIEFEYVKCATCPHLYKHIARKPSKDDEDTTHYYCLHPHWKTKRTGSIGTGSIYLSSDVPPAIGQDKCCPYLK